MKFNIFIGVILLSAKLMALSDPCSLQTTALPADINMSASEVNSYKSNLKKECDLTTSYRSIKSSLKNSFNVSIESITEYQALRFVRRADFEKSKQSNTPVELTYQILDSAYNLSNEQKSSVIWDNWIAGIKQLPSSVNIMLQGNVFGLEELKKVHVGFFTLSNEIGDHAWNPDPGKMKTPFANDSYWWYFNTESEAYQARQVVDTQNAFYAALGLLPKLPDAQLNRVLAIKSVLKRQPPDKKDVQEMVSAIYSGDSRAAKVLVQNILTFINSAVAQAKKNQHIVINKKLLTPAEVAYLAQQFYVGVHPFDEGNGRTSRFIQELILSVFDMPLGASGDLMDHDVLSTFSDYYAKAMQAQTQVLNTVSTCLDMYSMQGMDYADYSCRILKEKK